MIAGIVPACLQSAVSIPISIKVIRMFLTFQIPSPAICRISFTENPFFFA